jgi:hypothetical protein
MNIFEQLDRLVDIHGMMYDDIDTIDAAKNRIEVLEAKLKQLQEEISGPEAWLDNWAQHVGKCQGGYVCTCGLTLARAELSAALKGIEA